MDAGITANAIIQRINLQTFKCYSGPAIHLTPFGEVWVVNRWRRGVQIPPAVPQQGNTLPFLPILPDCTQSDRILFLAVLRP